MLAAALYLGAINASDDEWVVHSVSVRDQLIRVLSQVQSAETSQRGYLLTGRDGYLKPYVMAAEQLPSSLDRLAALDSDNPKRVAAVNKLRERISAKLGEIRSTIDAHKSGNTAGALAIINSDSGYRLMEEIRDQILAMQNLENDLLASRQASAERSGLLLQVGVAAAFLLIVLLGVLVARFVRQSFGALASAHDRLLASNKQLQEQIFRREQAEGQLRQAQKMQALGQLTGGIAHDFNNMLGVILGAHDLIKRRIGKGDFGIERFVEAASDAARRAATLTQRLLAFARQQPLAPQSIDANKMIGSMSDLLNSTLGEQVQIETVTAAGLWTISADAQQLENTILNIAINARDAMPDGGKLTIETANAYLDETYRQRNPEVEPGQFVMIAITDTGAGMSPETVAQVFDPFFTTKPTGKGTGLGMSQVYGFVKQSQGHIKVYSELGAGTTVKIYLPRFVGVATESKPEAAEPMRTGDRSEMIMVVEDEASMRRLSSEALNELGYTVFDSDNAANALAILDREPGIKLLFTDVVMPDVNGKKLADEACRRRPDLKVLFTTGYTANAVVHGGVLDYGVNLLAKPFTLNQLAAKIRSVLDR